MSPLMERYDGEFFDLDRERWERKRRGEQTLDLTREEVTALRTALDSELRVWREVRARMGADSPFDTQKTDAVIAGLSSVLKKLGV